MKPGHHPDLSNADYHGGPGISKSHLDQMARGPKVYWHNYVNPNRPEREQKPAWTLGSATHCAILEPDLFGKDFIVAPEPSEEDDVPKRPTKAQLNAPKKSDLARRSIDFWAEFDAKVGGRMVLNQTQFDQAWAMRDAVRKHPKAYALLKAQRDAGGRAEQSYYANDPETGALIKCRFDFDAPVKLDLKTTRDATPKEFARHVVDYRYGVQQAWYRKVFQLATGEPMGDWVFLVVDSEAPHQIGLYSLPEDYVQACARIAQENLRAIVEAKALDYWPDPGYDGVTELVIPRWAKQQLGMNSAENDFDGLE